MATTTAVIVSNEMIQDLDEVDAKLGDALYDLHNKKKHYSIYV
jgi:hypothetical protein